MQSVSIEQDAGCGAEDDAPGAAPAWTFTSQADPERQWLQPLRRAALLSLMPEDWPDGKDGGPGIVTNWDTRLDAPGGDQDKHDIYSAHMLSSIQEVMPWLVPLLTLTSAALLVSPGLCRYQLPGDPQLYEIPELVPYTYFLPWVTDADRQQPQ